MRINKTVSILGVVLALTAGCSTLVGGRADFDIRDYGGSVAKAAEAAAAAGGGRIVVPAGTWTSGTIELKDHCELHLEKGAVIRGSTNPADYNPDDVFPENFSSVGEEWSGGHLVLAYKAKDVAITGEGVIDGNGPAFFGEPESNAGHWYKYGLKLHPIDRDWYRPGPMIAMFLCENIRIEGVTLANTPCWTCHIRCCDGLDIRNVVIDADRTIANSDGFSIDGTRNVSVRDCVIKTGDDGFAIRASCPHHAATNLCENIAIENCDVSSCCFGIRFGVGTGTIRNVSVKNCRFRESAFGLGFTPAWVKGKRNVYIEDVAVEDCTVRECERAVLVEMPDSDARVKNIRFAHCRFEALLPSLERSTQQGLVENVIYEDCSLFQLNALKVRNTPSWDEAHPFAKRAHGFHEAFGPHKDAVKTVACAYLNKTPEEKVAPGALLLSFDDRHFDDWRAAIPLFEKYGAHATFYVTGPIDNTALRAMKRLREAGHSTGLHGLYHVNAPEGIAAMGEDGYYEADVVPQIEKCRVGYQIVESFAYPNCARNEASDALFRRKGWMKRVRGGVKGATPHDPEGTRQKDRKPLPSNDAVFTPAAEIASHYRIDTIIMGEAYHTDIDEILACLKRARDRKEIISITSHGIHPDAKHIHMKTEWLEKMLAYAAEIGLPVIGFEELPTVK